MKKKQIILNKAAINNKIKRIAFSIIEEYYQKKSITLIGFHKNGYTIAKKLKKLIEEEHEMNISLYRITATSEESFTIQPKLKNKELKNIFLVDDVLKSGRTIIYGIKEILSQPVESLRTIILVNRNHNNFPIGVDYVGLNLSTTINDHIEVILSQEEEVAYLI